MIVNVWLVYKAGEPRVYTWTVEPTAEQVGAFWKEGFEIFRAEIDLPVDTAITVLKAEATEV